MTKDEGKWPTSSQPVEFHLKQVEEVPALIQYEYIREWFPTEVGLCLGERLAEV